MKKILIFIFIFLNFFAFSQEEMKTYKYLQVENLVQEKNSYASNADTSNYAVFKIYNITNSFKILK